MSTKSPEALALDNVFKTEYYEYFNDDLLASEYRTAIEIKFLQTHIDLSETSDVLDVACGNGRHLIKLAPFIGRGLGIDSGEQFIESARLRAAEQGLDNISFQNTDALIPKVKGKFDFVLMLNGIFGVYGEAGDSRMLKAIHKRLKSQGELVFNIPNRDTILRDFSEDFVLEKDGDLMLDRCSFDPKSGRITNRRIYIRDGHRFDAPFSFRVYNCTEMAELLRQCEFSVERCYGDWTGEELGTRSPRLIFRAKKP